ncbi:unnamed protein product [Brassica oleracea var. botrytis]|uniref:(rape) hypothetical protein n=1 Tax=Brassica napus TaxID=3708 RepID=A0A816JC16_BRANA|nr:unnamed protein product [Brassica napus]
MCWLADIMATMMTKLLRLSTVSGKFRHKMRQATPYSAYLYLKDSQFSEVEREEYQFRAIGTVLVLDNGTQVLL